MNDVGYTIMGTNYYIKDIGISDSPECHIGKKSAAGLYCWNCNITLCIAGDKWIHNSSKDEHWYKKCPVCGQIPKKESLSESSAGRELGFNKGAYKKKTGVASCSSFTFAMPPEKVKLIPHIVNEYDDEFTQKEFQQILEECPIRYYSIGEWFS